MFVGLAVDETPDIEARKDTGSLTPTIGACVTARPLSIRPSAPQTLARAFIVDSSSI
jgi:hypothetical protein